MIRKFFRKVFGIICQLIVVIFFVVLFILGLLGIATLAIPVSIFWLLCNQTDKDEIITKFNKL